MVHTRKKSKSIFHPIKNDIVFTDGDSGKVIYKDDSGVLIKFGHAGKKFVTYWEIIKHEGKWWIEK